MKLSYPGPLYPFILSIHHQLKASVGPNKRLVSTCRQRCNDDCICPVKPGKNGFFLICCGLADRTQKQICKSAPSHHWYSLFCIFTAEMQDFEGRKLISCSCLFSSTVAQRKVHKGGEKFQGKFQGKYDSHTVLASSEQRAEIPSSVSPTASHLCAAPKRGQKKL